MASAPIALLATGCGADRIATYDDLVTSWERLASAPALAPPEQKFCGEENHFALDLSPAQVFELPLELGEEPELVVGGCLTPFLAGERPHRALRLRFRSADGAENTYTVHPRPRGWFEERLRLPELAGFRGTLEVRVALPRKQRLLVHDLYLRHLRLRRKAWSWGQGLLRRAPPQVVLISVDALRADAFARLGDEIPPSFSRFAAEMQEYSPHYAADSWTKPSHASLLTGLTTPAHGAILLDSPIDPGVRTLAERFREAGFATGGLVHACVWLDPKFGFDRGFEDYRVVAWDSAQALRAAANWIAEHREQPFFYFLHLFEVHSDFHRLPYESPGMTRAVVEKRFGLPAYGCRDGACASGLLAKINEGLAPLPREGEALHFLYDQSVRHLAGGLGGLGEDLRTGGLLQDLTVVLTSDHGEAFLEHGKTMHGWYWEEVLRIPLLIHWPRGEGGGERIEGASSAIDVAPTLLAAGGIPARDLPGQDLRRGPRTGPIFAGSLNSAVLLGSHKAIFFRQEKRQLLFDLAADPGEKVDLAASRPDLVTGLARLAERPGRMAEAAKAAESQAAPLSEEEKARLRALGYLR